MTNSTSQSEAVATQYQGSVASKVRPGSYALDKSHAKLNWAISHFGFSLYTGEFTGFNANLTLDPETPDKSRLHVMIDTKTVQTNHDKFNDHLRSAEFFDIAKFPSATYDSTRIEVTSPNAARVTGDLTLHGVTKPVVLEVTFNLAGENPVTKAYTVGFSATAAIKRTDFGINAFAPGVGDKVELTISAEFTSGS